MSTEESLRGAKEFFEKIVEPNVHEYMNTASQFRTAINTVTALFHMHEWLWQFKKEELEMKYEKSFAKAGAFWGHIEMLVPSSKFIRDLANASKHVRLTLRSSTSMTHIANTVIQSTGYGMGSYGDGRYGGQNVMMKDNGTEVSLDGCVTDLMSFWKQLLGELYS
ncbi:MAG: hypothetical protein R3D68_07055 [Hyphomicrobiaceae bacterium]